jgi:hypothetical protein
MKFTAYEAEDIRPLAVNSLLMDRGYGVMSVGQCAVPLRASVRNAEAGFRTKRKLLTETIAGSRSWHRECRRSCYERSRHRS